MNSTRLCSETVTPQGSTNRLLLLLLQAKGTALHFKRPEGLYLSKPLLFIASDLSV
jgi:hypothetical protein